MGTETRLTFPAGWEKAKEILDSSDIAPVLQSPINEGAVGQSQAITLANSGPGHWRETIVAFEKESIPFMLESFAEGALLRGDPPLSRYSYVFDDTGFPIKKQAVMQDFQVPWTIFYDQDLDDPDVIADLKARIEYSNHITAIPSFENQEEYAKRNKITKLIESF